MLMIRKISLEIIKKYKIYNSSKLGINAIRRMAINSPYLLINIINHWIFK